MALTKVQIDGVEFSDSTDLNVDNGTLVVDATNNRVGVGTASPGQRLDVAGDARLIATGDTARQIIFDANRSAAAATIANINFAWDGTNVAQIRGITGSDTANKDDAHLEFFTSAAGSLQPRMRIDSSGRLGLGTSSPSGLFDAAGSLGTVRIQASGANLEFTRNGGNTFLASGADGEFYFQTGGTNTRMFISKTGNVGIGTASANHKLHLNDSGANNVFTQYTNSATGSGLGDGSLVGVTSTGELLIAQKESNAIAFHTSNTEKARIDSSGRLLVGQTVSTTGAKVQVAGDVTLTGGLWTGRYSASSSSTGAITLGFTLGSYHTAVLYVASANSASSVQNPGMYLLHRGGSGAAVTTVAAHPRVASVSVSGSTGEITVTPNTSSYTSWTFSMQGVN